MTLSNSSLALVSTRAPLRAAQGFGACVVGHATPLAPLPRATSLRASGSSPRLFARPPPPPAAPPAPSYPLSDPSQALGSLLRPSPHPRPRSARRRQHSRSTG